MASSQFHLSSLSSTDFDWHQALSLASASELVYGNEAEVKSTANQWGLESVVFIDRDDTQCFLAKHENIVLIAFRGTTEIGDWITNLTLRSTRRPYGKVHSGFVIGFEDVESEIEAQLRSITSQIGRKPTVLLTGHSLGGALAIIAAAELQGEYIVSGVYTCGQPAVGRHSFHEFIREQYADKYHRFVNDNDIVTRLPPTYSHVGDLYHFDENGDLKHDAEALRIAVEDECEGPETLSTSEFRDLRKRMSKSSDLQDGATRGDLPLFRKHAISRYIELIANAVPKNQEAE